MILHDIYRYGFQHPRSTTKAHRHKLRMFPLYSRSGAMLRNGIISRLVAECNPATREIRETRLIPLRFIENGFALSRVFA
ncbi:MAG: hypothetical protein L6422_06465 [Candidatus Marinimicrobia bacterium]|nr:hypothetical protein [bacterium]MCG2715911.1 hypothetical protein [Candidatus Neomarinimicrobiota bacterium]